MIVRSYWAQRLAYASGWLYTLILHGISLIYAIQQDWCCLPLEKLWYVRERNFHWRALQIWLFSHGKHHHCRMTKDRCWHSWGSLPLLVHLNKHRVWWWTQPFLMFREFLVEMSYLWCLDLVINPVSVGLNGTRVNCTERAVNNENTAVASTNIDVIDELRSRKQTDY